MSKALLLIAILFLVILVGCDNHVADWGSNSQELLIYCGTTMSAAIGDIADVFEQRENCRVKIIKGGSGKLYQSIRINQVGDLYSPGSESYMQQCLNENIVHETRVVGFNQAALLVAKGNPLAISTDLNNFTNGCYRTVIGALDSSSIGLETEHILGKLGLYQQAVEQVMFFAVDSKDIVQAVEEKTADRVLNWTAAVLSEKKNNKVDVLPLNNIIAPLHPLILGVLKTSYDRELARRFIELAGSEEGQQIFARYGFYGAIQ